MLHQLAAETAARAEDEPSEAQSLEDLATVYGQLGRAEESITHNQRALQFRREIDDPRTMWVA